MLVLQATGLGLLWSSARLWTRVASWVPFLSMTGVAAGCLLVIALCAIALAGAWRWRDLALTPRQLVAALATGAACWAANQGAQLIDVALAHPIAPRPIDLSGAFLNAYSEEVLFRLLLLGAAAALLARRLPPRRAVWWAAACSTIVFALWHIPHDLVVGDIHLLLRYPSLLGLGGMFCLVYLTTGNLMTAALLHMIGNEPALVVAGPHALAITTVVNGSACIVVIASRGWYRGRARRAPPSAR